MDAVSHVFDKIDRCFFKVFFSLHNLFPLNCSFVILFKNLRLSAEIGLYLGEETKKLCSQGWGLFTCRSI